VRNPNFLNPMFRVNIIIWTLDTTDDLALDLSMVCILCTHSLMLKRRKTSNSKRRACCNRPEPELSEPSRSLKTKKV
jgi:hypothetical protein